MNVTTRRGLLGALLTGGVGLAQSSVGRFGAEDRSTVAEADRMRLATGERMPDAWASALNTDPAHQTRQAREQLRQRRLPNALLMDEQGQPVRFYDDIMKNRVVIMSVMYTVCSNICTPATRNLLEARRLLGPLGKEIQFVSMTLTPLVDGPAQLANYKKLHAVDPDWRFLTGTVEQVEMVQRAMGFLNDRETDDLLSHSGIAVFCDERRARWGHANLQTPPKAIARMVRFESV